MLSEQHSVSALYELREAALEHGKALGESECDPSEEARDRVLDTKLELEVKTVAALDEC